MEKPKDYENNRMKDCVMCLDKLAKYCCPGCQRRTCSLTCSKQHKLDFSCSGTRCKTEFIRLSKFNDSDLLNDYRFLEEVGRAASNATRDSHGKRKSFRPKEKRLQALARRHGVQLRLLPPGMSRRRENSSVADFKQDCIHWRVKLCFSNARETRTEERVAETTKIGDVIRKYTDKNAASAADRIRLRGYMERNERALVVTMTLAGNSKTEKKGDSVQLSLDSTLREALQGRTLIEYPELFVHLSPAPNKDGGTGTESAEKL